MELSPVCIHQANKNSDVSVSYIAWARSSSARCCNVTVIKCTCVRVCWAGNINVFFSKIVSTKLYSQSYLKKVEEKRVLREAGRVKMIFGFLSTQKPKTDGRYCVRIAYLLTYWDNWNRPSVMCVQPGQEVLDSLVPMKSSSQLHHVLSPLQWKPRCLPGIPPLPPSPSLLSYVLASILKIFSPLSSISSQHLSFMFACNLCL